MEITEIKQQLNILTVLDSYGIKPNKNNMAKCPFHKDDKPSLQIYPKTNTWHCFGCGKGSDGIDFIKYIENCTTHEAILKAEKLINHSLIKSTKMETTEIKPLIGPKRILALETAFKYFVQSLKTTTKAQEYLKSRNIDYTKSIAGYDNHNFHHIKRTGKELQELYLQLGLIFPDRQGRKDSYHSRFDGCIVFPTFDEQRNIVSMYGRKIDVKEREGGHYKLSGDHQGLYPKYPEPNTEILLITECIIDAATLLRHDFITEKYTLLSLYGAKIWTEEHTKAIRNLHQLKEIIFSLHGDKEGKEGTAKHSETVQKINSAIKISYIEIPEGEDINSIAQSHEDPQIFTEFINNRKPISNENPFFLSPEKKENGTQEKKENGTPEIKFLGKEKNEIEPSKTISTNGVETHEPTGKLNTENPHRLIYRTPTANYYIKGGLRKDLDSLKVSIDIENKQTHLKKRERLDLYIDNHTQKLSREAAEKLGLRADLIELDLSLLTDHLDEYREKIMQQEDPGEQPRDKTLTVPQHTATACLEFLQKPDLFSRLYKLTDQVGLTGEEKSRMLVLCIASSFKMKNTLHGIIQGTSGEGKTYLMTTICEMMPPEYWKPLTTMTDKSLFNMKKYQIQHHLFTIEDRAPMSDELKAYFREFQSKAMLIRDATVSDKEGNYSTKTQVIMGPIASISCTTEADIHQDDANRCFLISIDESKEQRRRIIEHNNKRAAGLMDKKKENSVRAFIQNCIRLLKPQDVVNTYATKLHLPEDAKDLIRLHNLFLGLVEQITIMHQYQRQKDNQGRLITQIEDVEIAVDVMFDAIVLKVDDLNEKLRKFFERLKGYVKEKGGKQYLSYNFKLLEIRMELDTSKTTVHENIQALLEMEYVQKVSGNEYRGYVYKIAYWDNINLLRTRIKNNLEEQINKIKTDLSVRECS